MTQEISTGTGSVDKELRVIGGVVTSLTLEFSLNVFSDKKIKNQKGGLQGWNPGPPV